VIEAEPGAARPLIGALVGSLSTSGDGIHVEISLDDGTYLVAFRPYGAAHRMIDAGTSEEVTGRFARLPSGVDVLAPWRSARGALDTTAATTADTTADTTVQTAVATSHGTAGDGPAATARVPLGTALDRGLVVASDDLLHGDPTEQWVARLAQVEPQELLRAARDEVDAEGDLRRATAVARATPEDAATVTQLEDARADAGEAERRHNRFRVITLVAGSTLPVGAVVGLNTLGVAGAVGLIGATLALTTGCLAYERKLAHALEHENEVVAASGGASYEDVHERLKDSPLVDVEVRSTLLAAAERYRTAAVTWQQLAGNIPAPWVLAQGERIRRTAELRAAVAPAGPTHPSPLPPEPRSAALIAGLTSRVADNRALGGGDESLPLFLDEPLLGLEWSEKAPVLEFLGRLATHHQLVLVSADEEVLSWARLEAMAGTIGAITSAGPSRPPAPDTADDPRIAHTPAADATTHGSH
jgi:hypothetical protein